MGSIFAGLQCYDVVGVFLVAWFVDGVSYES